MSKIIRSLHLHYNQNDHDEARLLEYPSKSHIVHYFSYGLSE